MRGLGFDVYSYPVPRLGAAGADPRFARFARFRFRAPRTDRAEASVITAVVFMLGGWMGSLAAGSGKNAGAAPSPLAPSPTV
jgi:hypothetical protein